MKALGVVEIQNKWFWHSFTLQYPPASTEAKKKKKHSWEALHEKGCFESF